MTLNYLLNYLRTRRPASLKVCALLDKRVRRLVDVPLEYRGFEIPDGFIGVLKPETREEEIPAVRDEAKQKGSPK
jgi:hypoxanthine-guanine phosphoribosyltransferase